MASWFLVRIVSFKAFLKGVVTMSCGNPLWTERTSSVYPMKYWRNILKLAHIRITFEKIVQSV